MFKQINKSIKRLDRFSVSKNFNLANQSALEDNPYHNKKTKRYRRKVQDKIGSPFGGVLTISLYLFIIVQFWNLWTRMHSGVDDNSKVTSRANHLQDGEDRIDVLNS